MAIESKRLKNGQWSHTIRLQHNNLIVKETVRGITKSQARIVENELFTKLIKGPIRGEARLAIASPLPVPGARP